jgi:hypothetical protein
MARVDVIRTNHTQCLPYASKDILEHQQLYSNVLAAFGELFEWLEHAVSALDGMRHLNTNFFVPDEDAFTRGV